MRKNSIVFFLFFYCVICCFSMGKKDSVIINASLDNIEQTCQKNKFALFYSADNSNAIQVAIKGGNLGVAEWLVENEICDLNHQNIYGKTPLNDAVDASDIELLKLLIKHGAKIRREIYIQDPVVQSVVVGNLEAAEFFSELGIKYNFTMQDGKNMLHLAAKFSQKDIVPFLVKNGCKINALDSEKLTPLLISVINDDSDVLETLLKNGAEIEKKNDVGQTPVFFAIERFSNSALQTLIDKKANIEVKDSKNRTPFLFAYEIDNFDAATSLLKAGGSFPRQQLLIALKEQKLSYLPLLLEAGADITATDSNGQNVLHICSSSSDGNSLTLFLGLENAKKIINSKDNRGNTPLLLACGSGHGFTTGVKLLLDSGASVSDTDSAGNFSIHVALANNNDSASKELSQVILKKDPTLLNVKNSSGQTPLIVALKNSKSESGAYFIALKADVTPKDSSGNTGLHYACAKDMDEIARKIVALGGDINAINNINENPICICAKNKNEPLSDYFLSFRNINIDLRDSSGKSARTYLWDLYDLRIDEANKRREEYRRKRQQSWDDAASTRNNIYDTESKIRDLESKNRNLESQIRTAKEGTNTSGWQSQITSNNISITAYNVSLAAYKILLNRQEKEADEYSKKIDEEHKVVQGYIKKKDKLNSIPRR